MNNQNQYQAPNQQPQYQQPQYQQPQYQQPQYQQQAPKKQGNGLDGLINFVIKLLPILTIVFFAFGATSLIYNFINGVVNSLDYYGGFGEIVYGIANGFAAVAKYFFYGVVCVGIYKIVKK